MSKNVTSSDAGNMISLRYLDRIVGLPEVEWAEPVLIGNGLFRSSSGFYESVRVVGCRRPRFAGGPWRFAQADEHALLDLEAITVDRLDLAKLGNPALEEITEIGQKRVRVRAVTNGARGFQGTLVFASIEKVREISRTPPGRASVILVRFAAGSDAAQAITRLRAILPYCSVYSNAELSGLTRRYYFSNTGIGGSFGFSTLIAVLIGAVIISLTMYTSVLGRTQDFAVMRAIGARKSDIAVVVFMETAIIAGTGLFIGFIMLAILLNKTGNSSIPSYFPEYVAPLLAAVTLIVSLMGSVIALRTAIKTDPAAVFH